MTDDMMNLRTLVEKSADADGSTRMLDAPATMPPAKRTTKLRNYSGLATRAVR